MKHTLVPIVLALGFAGAAQAQMTIYGLIDASYGKSIAADAAGQKADFHSGGDNGSGEGNSTTRVGIKGSMDVGSGFKANFRFETGGITSDGEVNPGGAFFNRQAWAGISGSFGEVRLGRQDSIAFQLMAPYDFNGASNGVSSLGYSAVAPWLPGRQSRSLQYISPDLGGVTVQLGFVPEGNVRGDKNTFSGGVTYAAGPLSVSATFESKRTERADSFMSVGGTYDFGAAKVMLGYADGGTNVKGLSAGFNIPVGKTNFGMLYGKNSDTKGSAVEAYVNSEVLKNTIAYFEVGSADRKTGVKGTGFAAGVIFIF
jgi:predicted porin